MRTRRQFVGALGASAVAGLISPSAFAETVDGWPSRTVRVISPTATGGPSQNFRFYSDNLKSKFGEPFVLENMPGGSGSIGCMTVARSAPDGHTILLASNSFIVLAPLVIQGNPVNVKRDFDPIALLFTFPFLLVVNPGLGVKTVKELVAYAKARPGELNWGSPGVGTGGHLVTELFLKQTGIKGQHIPYPGTTQQLLACAAGTLQFTFDTPGNSKGVRDGGKVIALAVTGDKRSNTAPEVPTFKELGYDLVATNWFALAGPAGLPGDVVQKVNATINTGMAQPSNQATVRKDGMIIDPMDVPTYQAFVAHEAERWKPVILKAGLKME